MFSILLKFFMSFIYKDWLKHFPNTILFKENNTNILKELGLQIQC